MKIKNKTLTITSLLILISVSIIGTILHEVAHYLTALLYGLQPELHHNYVDLNPEEGTEVQNTIVAASGPLFSLLFGILSIFISRRSTRPSVLKLFMLWLGLYNILMFLGYFFIAPFAKEGDTGKVFDYFKTPTLVIIAIAITAFIIILKFFFRISNEFKFYRGPGKFNMAKNSKQLFLLPIIGSILLFTVLNLPVVTWISLLPTIFMPMAFFSIMGSYNSLELKKPDFVVNNISWSLLLVTLLSIIVFRLLI